MVNSSWAGYILLPNVRGSSYRRGWQVTTVAFRTEVELLSTCERNGLRYLTLLKLLPLADINSVGVSQRRPSVKG